MEHGKGYSLPVPSNLETQDQLLAILIERDGLAPTLMNMKKDHEIAQLVNQLTAIAKEFHSTQQLRERISGCIHTFLGRT